MFNLKTPSFFLNESRMGIYRDDQKPVDDLLKKIEKTIDAIAIRGAVPERGSIVYCDLGIVAEHTGIYTGYGDIIHLNGDGYIEAVDAKTFINRLNNKNFAFTIFCPANNRGGIIGSDEIADRALSALGDSRKYNLLFDNCHRFTYYCLTGNSNFLDGSFSSLEIELKRRYYFSKWRATNLGYPDD